VALGSSVERATDDLVRRLRQAAATGAGSLDIRAAPAVVAELRREAGGKDIASWVGRMLDIESDPHRDPGNFVVTTR
jgi:hypothetical protein